MYFDEFPQNIKKRFYDYWMPNLFQYAIKKNYKNKKLTADDYVFERQNYYNKLSENISLDSVQTRISSFNSSMKYFRSFYFFDTYRYIKHFDSSCKISFVFGDVTHIPDIPSIVKSRPIDGNNENSILMNLDRLRHFQFVDDRKNYKDKKDLLVWRGAVHQPHRVRFMEHAFSHPLCDVGQTNHSNEHPQWKKEKMRIRDQLNYKFLFSIEGNDVATSLKWMMSSKSLVFMQKPKYETWFMEGRLIPNHHYVIINDNLSNLEEKIKYYIDHTEEALKIVDNANKYVEQFQNQEREDLIHLLVLEKYFKLSGQLR